MSLQFAVCSLPNANHAMEREKGRREWEGGRFDSEFVCRKSWPSANFGIFDLFVEAKVDYLSANDFSMALAICVYCNCKLIYNPIRTTDNNRYSGLFAITSRDDFRSIYFIE